MPLRDRVTDLLVLTLVTDVNSVSVVLNHGLLFLGQLPDPNSKPRTQKLTLGQVKVAPGPLP